MAGTEVLNGTQLPLDAAYVLNLLAGNKLTERGQDIGYNEALLGYYSAQQDAEDRWALEREQLGQAAADLNFRQRNADALNELQRQSGVLGRDTLNFQQRSDVAGKKMGILDMLNSRRGPSNWVRYSSLLDALDPPSPERTATIDPFTILEGLDRPSDAFSAPVQSVNQPYSSGLGARPGASMGAPASLLRSPAPMGSAGGGGGGGLFSARPPAAQPASIFNWNGPKTNNPATNITGQTPEDVFSGVRSSELAGLKSGQNALKYTGTAGPSFGRDYTDYRVSDPATGKVYGPDDEIKGGTALWLTRLGRGGMVGGDTAPMALTGDGTGERPNEDSELVMALLNEAGQPVLKVMNPEQTKAAMRSGVRPRRAAGGGTYGGANTTPTIELSQYGSQALGNQGFIRKLFSGNAGPQFQRFGAKLSNPSIGIENAPSLLNLQTLRDLYPSQKDATSELYESGLDTDFRDVIERSRRAAPFGRTFGPAGYGIG